MATADVVVSGSGGFGPARRRPGGKGQEWSGGSAEKGGFGSGPFDAAFQVSDCD